jgi:hypothetical protein
MTGKYVIASEARSDTRGNPQIESTEVSAACSVCALTEGDCRGREAVRYLNSVSYSLAMTCLIEGSAV